MFKWGLLVGGGVEGLCPRGWMRGEGANFPEGASMSLCMIIIGIYIFDVAVSE